MRVPRHLPDVKHARQGRTAVYRFYDARGDLLYVGITNSPRHRFAQHADNPDNAWWQYRASHRITWYDTRQQALRAEYIAIREERPIHNKMHNLNWRAGCSYRPPSRTRGPGTATLAGTLLLSGALCGAWSLDLPMVIMVAAFTFLAGCLLWNRITE